MTDMSTGKSYRAPANLLKPGKEGELLEWSLQQCYDTAPWQTIFREGMGGVVRQTVYGWTQTGLPPERAEQFQAFIDDPETDFVLPSNTTIENFLRPRESRPKDERPQKRNDPLIDFLVAVIKAPEPFGLAALEAVAARMRNISSVHLFWKWGYNDGGVPVTYIEDFLRDATDLSLYKTLDIESYRKPEVFAAYVRKAMCEDPTYYEKVYKLDVPAQPHGHEAADPAARNA